VVRREKPKQPSHPRKKNEKPSQNAMLVIHALVATEWIVDSGTTCHMCNDESMFTEMITKTDFPGHVVVQMVDPLHPLLAQMPKPLVPQVLFAVLMSCIDTFV
jgi:hypothetical protein